MNTDAPEANLLVYANRGCICERRVNGDPMMSRLVDQLAHDPTRRFTAEPASVQGRIKENVDGRMAVL